VFLRNFDELRPVYTANIPEDGVVGKKFTVVPLKRRQASTRRRVVTSQKIVKSGRSLLAFPLFILFLVLRLCVVNFPILLVFVHWIP
jgi:hypothetical protein